MRVTPEQVRASLSHLIERKTAYQLAFGDGAASSFVLADLAKFCRADESCFSPDARVQAMYEGRREVWLRIQQHLKETPEQLLERYAGHQVRVEKIEENDDGR